MSALTDERLHDPAVLRRIALRFRAIMQEVEAQGARGLAQVLDIEAGFRFEDDAVVRFRLAAAILSELEGLPQELVLGALLELGIESLLAVASAAARDVRGQEKACVTGLPADPPKQRFRCSRAGRDPWDATRRTTSSKTTLN